MKFLVQYLLFHRDEDLLNREKEENDKTVAPLEPFLESCLQVRIFTEFSIDQKTNNLKSLNIQCTKFHPSCYIIVGARIACHIICHRSFLCKE